MTEETGDKGTQGSERSGGRVRSFVAAVVAAAMLAGGVGYFLGRSGDGHDHGSAPGDNAAKSAAAPKAEKYTCGMHPFIISDKPGNCPICGMALTKVSDGAPAGGGTGKERKLLYYRNPMNPEVHSPVPAKDSMGMDYVPVYEDEVAGAGGRPVEGYATVSVGAESLKLAGVQSAPAVRERIGRSIRTVGIVVPDETRVRRVTTKVEGYVEKLHTNFTGQVVTKGQPLLSVYSPELLATQEEFLQARETASKFSASGSDDIRKMGTELLQSSRRRLELFDVPPGFIADLERTGKPRRTVTLNAPVSGYVTAKGVSEGQQVMPGMELFTVTDLSRVWIEADLYEYEAGTVRVGQQAVLAPAFDPGMRLKGKVAYVNPALSPESRTLKVRFEFPNPGLKLKPQMYADVLLETDSATAVTIPDSALIETGLRQVVFVDAGGGNFEPREVRVGIRRDGKAQVLSGLHEGEKVAVRANFLLDSESRLRAALTRMTGGPAAVTPPAAGPATDNAGSGAGGAAPAAGHAGHGGAR